jgi:hypothetical protein
MFKVIKSFADAQDNGHIYNVGDTFPRPGMKVDDDRIKWLSSTSKERMTAYIAEEAPKRGPSEAKEDTQEPEAASKPSSRSEAKRRPRKG